MRERDGREQLREHAQTIQAGLEAPATHADAPAGAAMLEVQGSAPTGSVPRDDPYVTRTTFVVRLRMLDGTTQNFTFIPEGTENQPLPHSMHLTGEDGDTPSEPRAAQPQGQGRTVNIRMRLTRDDTAGMGFGVQLLGGDGPLPGSIFNRILQH